MRRFDTFADAYRQTLLDLTIDGERVAGVSSTQSIGSGFGTAPRPFIELQGAGFCLQNPRARWLDVSPRSPNLPFSMANFIFTLAGGHEPEMIAAYNYRGQQFTEDQSRYESAFGARLFSPGHQIAYAMKKLESDRLSRRATAMIYSLEDTLLDRRDTPCAIALQFMIRGEKLDCVCLMRSQSAAMVMPYDVYLFTMIQEWLAVMLCVDVGTYTHVAASLHFYTEEQEVIDAVLASTCESVAMPHMTSAGPAVARDLIEAERQLRRAGWSAAALPSEGLLDPYWSDQLALLTNFQPSLPPKVQ